MKNLSQNILIVDDHLVVRKGVELIIKENIPTVKFLKLKTIMTL